MSPNELNEKQLDSITAAGGVNDTDQKYDTFGKHHIISDEELKRILIDEFGIDEYEKHLKIIVENW